MNNYDLLTDNQKAFVKAMRDSSGVSETATIEFLLTDTATNFLKYSPYCDFYSQLADSYDIWQLAINFERNRCYSICEHDIGTEGDGQHCADAIGANHD
jgi:hypothetical protein